MVQKSAGLGNGRENNEYISAGDSIFETAKEVFNPAEMIMKVKEPLTSEYDFLKPGQILFTCLHFASFLELTQAMMKRKVICIAYETIETIDRQLSAISPYE